MERGLRLSIRMGQVGLLFLWGTLATWLLLPRGGLQGEYAVELPSGELVRLHEQLDPVLDFPTPHLLQRPFFQFWDLESLGVPKEIPAFQVRWRGALHARETGRYRFHLQAAGQVRLLLDEQWLAPEPGQEDQGVSLILQRGWHAIDLTYRRHTEEPRFRLLWSTPRNQSLEPVPRDVLVPSVGSLRRRTLTPILGALLLLGWGVTVWRLWRRRHRAETLGAFVTEHAHSAALVAILFLALALRLYQYDLIPFHHETADEYQHGWEGWTLLHEGVPRAWTFYPMNYPAERISPFNWYGDSYYVARPYFDHPPGFSLMVGAVSTLLGAEAMLDCTLWRMRLLPILLSLITTFLVARVGWSLLGCRMAGTLSALLYATLPTIVLGNRLVKAENFLAPLFLVQSLLIARYLREQKGGDLGRLALTGFAAIWAKATGIALPAAAVLCLGFARRWKAAVIVLSAAAAAIATYFIYGALLDWDLFRTVLSLQASKWIGLRSVLDLTLLSRVVELQFGGGWYLFLAIAAGWLALRPERELLAPAAVYFLILVVSIDQRAVYGWYRLPLYPYLCLAGGLLLADWWRERDPGRGFLFAATALATSFYYALPIELGKTRAAILAIFALACVAPLFERFHSNRGFRWAGRWGVALSLAGFFLANVATVAQQVPVYLREGVRGKLPALGGQTTAPPPGEVRSGAGAVDGASEAGQTDRLPQRAADRLPSGSFAVQAENGLGSRGTEEEPAVLPE